MAVYFVAQINIHDESLYRQYLDGVSEVFKQYNGKYLAVDNAPMVLEGSWTTGRTVLIEFPSEHEFRRWYESAEYQAILRHRLMAAECNAVLVKGE